MKLDTLFGDLGRGKIPAVIVLHGEERWFVSEAVRLVRERFLEEDEEGFESFDAPRGAGDREGTGLGAVVEEARTRPMFGGRKVLLYRAPSLEESEVRLLAELAGAKPGFSRTVVALGTLPTKAEKELTKAGAATAQCRKLFDTAWPGQPEWKTPLNSWLVGRSRHHGKRLTLQTAHLLSSIMGSDLGELDGALTKMALAAGEKPEITEAEVRALTGQGRDFDAFAFGDAVYSREARRAWRVARNAFQEGVVQRGGKRSMQAAAVAARLLWSLRYRLKDVYAARRMLDQGRSTEEVVRALGRNKAAAERTARAASGYRLETLRRHFVMLADLEAELHSGGDEQSAIEGLIPELVGERDG